MRLIALKQIPNAVAMIMPGQVFIEENPEQADYWVLQGFAENPQAKPVSRTGWNELQWDRATVCIMASGPSMSAEQAAVVWRWCIADDGGEFRRAITINTTFRLAPWAHVLYACDARWWKLHYEEATDKFSGQLWTQDVEAKREYPTLNLIRSQRADGLGRRPGVIHQGGSSGYQAINLAWMAGAKRIILLGYDNRNVDKLSHWHGDHPAPITSTNPYKMWQDNFMKLAADLGKEGVEVVNCTPQTALQCFPKKSLTEALA